MFWTFPAGWQVANNVTAIPSNFLAPSRMWSTYKSPLPFLALLLCRTAAQDSNQHHARVGILPWVPHSRGPDLWITAKEQERSLLVQRLTLMVLQRKRDCDKLIGPMNKKISLSWGMSRSYPTKWRYFNWCAWRRVFPNSAATDRGPMRDCRVALKCSIWFARQKMFGWWSCTGMNWGLNFLHLLGKWKWRAIFLSTL